jgi:hypothetical protein
MAITPVRLRKVITGTKQKYFDLDVLDTEGNIVGRRLYIANIEKNSNNVKEILELGENTPPSQLTNTCNIFSSAGGVKDLVIRNMFEVTDNPDFETRSYAYANKTDLEFNKADDYSDLFIDNTYQISSIVGFNDSVFTLTNQLNSVTYYPLNYIGKDQNNNMVLNTEIIRDPLYTAIFDSVSALENLSYSDFNNKFIPKYLINGIQYNNVIDYPMSVYPLFKDNTLLGNAIICKNHLGYDYSQHSIEEYNDDSTVVRKFTEMRSYKRLVSSGDNVYLIYDNMYEAETVPYKNESTNNSTIININNNPIEPISNIEKLDESINTYANQPNTILDLNAIEKVEQFNSVNRFTRANNHKSNLYSIEIEDLGLNSIEKTADEKVKAAIKNIKKSITNNIKKICQNVQPGNTQLFSVFYTGN